MTVRSMPAGVAVAALCCAVTGAWGTEFGRVVSSTPAIASVPVAQQQCYDEPVVYQRPNSGAGALLGAIAGAAIGNGIGAGVGRAAATGLGMVAGAAVGDRVEANGSPPVSTTAQRCRNVTRYESRTVGYDVVYEYQGVRRSARLAQDPGDQIALEINVAPTGGQAYRRGAPVPPAPEYEYGQPDDMSYRQGPLPTPNPQPPVYAQPPVYYAQPPVYYAQPPMYAQPWPYVVIGGNWGWHGGHRRY